MIRPAALRLARGLALLPATLLTATAIGHCRALFDDGEVELAPAAAPFDVLFKR